MTTRTITTDVPENTSLLQPTKFTFEFPDMPQIKYYCQSVAIPGMSTTEIAVPTMFNTTYRHGEQINFDPLTITAIIDEDFRVVEETMKWLYSLTRPTDFNQYPRKFLGDKTPLYKDGILTINTNANLPNFRIKFHDCHPTMIGGVPFDTKISADTIMTVDITYRYDYWTIERL